MITALKDIISSRVVEFGVAKSSFDIFVYVGKGNVVNQNPEVLRFPNFLSKDGHINDEAVITEVQKRVRNRVFYKGDYRLKRTKNP